MTTRRDFLKAIMAAGPRQKIADLLWVYSDWLEDHGELDESTRIRNEASTVMAGGDVFKWQASGAPQHQPLESVWLGSPGDPLVLCWISTGKPVLE